ncbi:hypothetical protein Bca4012_058927 [Brassica carinata]
MLRFNFEFLEKEVACTLGEARGESEDSSNVNWDDLTQLCRKISLCSAVKFLRLESRGLGYWSREGGDIRGEDEVVVNSSSSGGAVKQEQEHEDEECSRKRGRTGSCVRPGGTKACRERLRREKLNEKYNISELEETNQKLLEEIKSHKAEKNELREEKPALKAEKEKTEQQLKSMCSLKLLLELNRALRPGGFFVWSATAVYRKNEEDSGIWKAMSVLTKAMCWKLVIIKKDKLNEECSTRVMCLWKACAREFHSGPREVEDWSNVRNVMDMRELYGGFAAALKDLKLWVMNVVPVDVHDTLPVIYERGSFGIFHDWCESFNTYPRTYDLLHDDHLFSTLRKRV